MTSTTVVQMIKAWTQTELEKGGDNTMAKNDINPLLENFVVFPLKTEGVAVFPNFAKICLKEWLSVEGESGTLQFW